MILICPNDDGKRGKVPNTNLEKSPFFKRKIQESEDNLRFSQVAEFEKGEKKEMS